MTIEFLSPESAARCRTAFESLACSARAKPRRKPTLFAGDARYQGLLEFMVKELPPAGSTFEVPRRVAWLRAIVPLFDLAYGETSGRIEVNYEPDCG